MKALVTGGGGFLGGAILRGLLRKGHQVRSFSRGVYPVLEELGVEALQGDVAEAARVQEACRNCEVVFHVAAKAGIWGKYGGYYQSNVKGTENVIEACRREGISRLVYTSSPSVIFDGEDMEGVDERVPYPKRYKAAYPQTKAAAERLVLKANDATLSTVALRPHLVWGPGDTHLIPGIVARGRTGRLRRIGKTSKLVDFTYVDDAAAAHLLAADRLSPGSSISGRAFFISQGRPMPLWDFIGRVMEAADLPVITRTVPPWVAYAAACLSEGLYRLLPLEGEPPITRFLTEELATAHWFDISAARRELGYDPQVSMEEGFRRLREWLHHGDTE
jgi:nucleoside-diphosphate-sugar epimerase